MQLFSVMLMSGLGIQVLQLFLALSLLIVLHEGGHFFFARLFKTRVEKFYLFFDFLFPFSNILPFALFKKKKGGTEYGIGWFPLGGYVKIAGMVDESTSPDELSAIPEPWEFRAKPAWQRLLIMLGGILVNVVTAIFIYAMVLFAWGEKRLPVSEMKDGVMVVDSLGYKLGFKNGDQLLAVNGQSFKYYDQMIPELVYARSVTIRRNGQTQELQFPVNFIEQLIDNKGRILLTPRFPIVIGSVAKGTGAEKAGLKPDDRITSVNGQPVRYFDEIKSSLDTLKNRNIAIQYLHDGALVSTTADVSAEGTLGFQIKDISNEEQEKMGLYHFETRHYGFFEAFPAGASMAWSKLSYYVRQFGLIFQPKTGAYKGIGGFGSMAKIWPTEWDWHAFWNITAFISLILAFMNLLPIPGLDGGYVLFLLVEMITRRKVPEKVMGFATTVGLVLLLALMLYANGMDVFRAFK